MRGWVLLVAAAFRWSLVCHAQPWGLEVLLAGSLDHSLELALVWWLRVCQVERLQKESEMSVEELLAKYKEQVSYSSPCACSLPLRPQP